MQEASKIGKKKQKICLLRCSDRTQFICGPCCDSVLCSTGNQSCLPSFHFSEVKSNLSVGHSLLIQVAAIPPDEC